MLRKFFPTLFFYGKYEREGQGIFFVSIAPAGVEMQTDITQFLDFITTIVFAFGIAFEVPVATVLIVWAGLTDTEKLAKARPYVFLMAFIASS